jgi:hypothetical protein
MKNHTQIIERKDSKIKGRPQQRRERFDSVIPFSAGKKRVTVRVPAQLNSLIVRAARKLKISRAEFARSAVREFLRVERAVSLPHH